MSIVSLGSHFCELPVSPRERESQVAIFIEQKAEPFWEGIPTDIDRSRIKVNISHLFLSSLLKDPILALSDSEKMILQATKSFEKKTQFFLNYPGAAMIITAAVASAVASGAGFYYGVNQAPVDSLQVAFYMGLGALVGSFASNMLGFYITGTLPNKASEAENKEQNMWDAFIHRKAEPAAYQLIEWFSPVLKAAEPEEEKFNRRKIAQFFIESLDFEQIVNRYKARGTQYEKIELVFRHLYEAKLLIEAQIAFESNSTESRPILAGLMTHALTLGYFKAD